MIILALDLGTSTGYAIGISKELSLADKMIAGTKVLANDSVLRAEKKTRANRRFDCRAANLFGWLRTEVLNIYSPDVVVFEDVKFASSQAQAHLWGSLRGALWSACALQPKVRVDCLDTGKLKIWGAEHGHADKKDMARALVRKEPGEYILYANGLMRVPSAQILDDNAVDAIHLLRWAQSIYGK